MSQEAFRWVITFGVGLGVIAFVVQCAVMVMLYRLARRTQRQVMDLAPSVAEKARLIMTKAEPILDKGREIAITGHQIMADNRAQIHAIVTDASKISAHVRETVSEVHPRVSEIAAQASDVSKIVREQVDQIHQTLNDVNHRVRDKVHRVDGAVDHAVDSVDEVKNKAKKVVLKPVRGIEGIWSGVRTAVLTYRRMYQTNGHTQPTQVPLSREF